MLATPAGGGRDLMCTALPVGHWGHQKSAIPGGTARLQQAHAGRRPLIIDFRSLFDRSISGGSTVLYCSTSSYSYKYRLTVQSYPGL
jgi:hypothetical protein